MESQRLSQLIGLVYDSAVDLELWPVLLQGMMEELDACTSEETRTLSLPSSEEKIGEYISQWYETQEQDSLSEENSIRYFSRSEGELFGLLLPHLRRAVKINRDISELQVENQAFASVLERLPIGMAVVDSAGRVYAKNRRLDSILDIDNGLCIEQGILQASNREDKVALLEIIEQVNAGPDDNVGKAIRLSSSTPVSLLVLPLFQTESSKDSNRAIVFVASIASDISIEPVTLIKMYGLTKAEARLTIALAKGSTLEEASEQFHVSRHTLRTQLKSIYSKTSCRRQAELMVKILTSPAILTTKQPETGLGSLSLDENILVDEERLSQSVFLRDGRRLGYAEYGPMDGKPVVLMHSVTGSRLQVPEDEGVLYEQGIRLLAPERPGIGLSDGKKNRTILDWAKDIEEFADCLGLKKFGLMGNSVGACFALAVAHELPERVLSVTLLNPIAEFYKLDELEGIIPLFKMMLGLAKYMPSITLPFMRLAMRGLMHNPNKYYASIVKQMPVSDYEIFSAPGFRETYLASALEALRSGEQGVTTEQLMVARAWGFSLSDISVPVTIWHGEDDRHNPLYMAKSLSAEIPDVRLNVIAGGGHFLIYTHWVEIIQSLPASRGVKI